MTDIHPSSLEKCRRCLLVADIPLFVKEISAQTGVSRFEVQLILDQMVKDHQVSVVKIASPTLIFDSAECRYTTAQLVGYKKSPYSREKVEKELSPEEKAQQEKRRAHRREKWHKLMAAETPEAREKRLARRRELKAAKRAAETPEEREKRLRKQREYEHARKAAMTKQQRAAELEKQAEWRRKQNPNLGPYVPRKKGFTTKAHRVSKRDELIAATLARIKRNSQAYKEAI